jgi:hypothetical protein
VEPYCGELSRGTLDALGQRVDVIARRLGLQWPV